MTLRQTISLAALAAALCLASAPQALAQRGKKSDNVVKAKATAGKLGDDGKQVITITLDVESPYHIYANPVGLDEFKDNETSVSVTGKAKPQSVKVDYPAGETIKDKTVGNYKVYTKAVTIKATVQRAKGDKDPLEVTIKVQACDERACLMPGKIKLTVP
jgi:thiol:disulfide interchange protein